MIREEDFDALCERITNARDDAEYNIRSGRDGAVELSTDDCDQLGELLIKAFGAALTGKQDTALADQLAILSGAFKGSEDDEA